MTFLKRQLITSKLQDEEVHICDGRVGASGEQNKRRTLHLIRQQQKSQNTGDGFLTCNSHLFKQTSLQQLERHFRQEGPDTCRPDKIKRVKLLCRQGNIPAAISSLLTDLAELQLFLKEKSSSCDATRLLRKI